jgi:hypothetical protein
MLGNWARYSRSTAKGEHPVQLPDGQPLFPSSGSGLWVGPFRTLWKSCASADRRSRLGRSNQRHGDSGLDLTDPLSTGYSVDWRLPHDAGVCWELRNLLRINSRGRLTANARMSPNRFQIVRPTARLIGGDARSAQLLNSGPWLHKIVGIPHLNWQGRTLTPDR